ncbi:MAG: DUF3179 domain-containing (seleno)protein [Pseudomonadota bacterium]
MGVRLLAAIAAAGLWLCGPTQASDYAAPSQISFVPLDLAGHVGGLEPVLSVSRGDVTKIYPLRILALHGVINDTLAGRDLALTYCGPCGTVGAFQTNGNTLTASIKDGEIAMVLTDVGGKRWSQADGEPLGARQAMLKAMPSSVVSMARARQAAGADQVVLVLQDTERSRIPIPKTLALPGAGNLQQDVRDEDESNTTKVLDARSWSLDVLSPEKRLTGEERLILLEQRQGDIQGPPRP